MERHTYAARVLPGMTAEYRRLLGIHWDEICQLLDANQVHNFSLWNAEDLVFAYCETDAACDLWPAFTEIAKAYDDCTEAFSGPGNPMRLMYTDLGIIRESKELIRHRVFMTKLVPGSEDEYKARHDALTASKGGAVSPGPDSNFTIWCAGGHIFGYDEIDITMEQDMTPEEREFTINWETRMLEIMSWITNDVDWITKENHVAVKKLASHH